MGRLIGLILMLIAIYVGISLYTEGTDHAFGGILASPASDPAPRPRPVTQRVRERVTEDLRSAAERVERAAGD